MIWPYFCRSLILYHWSPWAFQPCCSFIPALVPLDMCPLFRMFFLTLHPQTPLTLLILIHSLDLPLNLTSAENPSLTPSDEVMCPYYIHLNLLCLLIMLIKIDNKNILNYIITCLVVFFFYINLSSVNKGCFFLFTIVSLCTVPWTS